MEFLIIGVAAAFNMIIIKIKLEKSRYFDAILDSSFLATVTYVFSGSYGALVVGTIASAIFSIYLLVFPPKFGKDLSKNPKFEEFKRELKQRLKDR